jgi:hypothetical protein
MDRWRSFRTPTRIRTGAPAIGVHNDEILTEIGIDPATRKRLKEAGIIESVGSDEFVVRIRCDRAVSEIPNSARFSSR